MLFGSKDRSKAKKFYDSAFVKAIGAVKLHHGAYCSDAGYRAAEYTIGFHGVLHLDIRRDAALCAQVKSPFQRLYRFLAAGYKDTAAEAHRHSVASFWLAIAIIPLLIIASSTLGFVFGLQAGRPGWYRALQAPAFVIMAKVSGMGLLIIIAAILRKA